MILERQLASDHSPVNALCRHIEQYQGKRLRPLLVLSTGLAAAGPPCDGSALTDRHRVVAAVVEMIHLATLVHDDVLDEARLRRRVPTLNHLRGNETAVMLGVRVGVRLAVEVGVKVSVEVGVGVIRSVGLGASIKAIPPTQ